MYSNGRPRAYLRDVPPGYRPGTPLALVLDFPGYLEGPQVESSFSGLGRFGERHDFITVTPEGSGAPVQWHVIPGSADMRYVGNLLDEVEAQLCINMKRVYATGLSNGAMMTSAVACIYADRFAAVSPVAGIQTPPWCSPSRPVPVVAFHGTADPFLPYTGGLGPNALGLPAADGSKRTLAQTGLPPGWQVPNVGAAAAAWATRNGCSDVSPRDERVTTDVTRRTFGCSPDRAVQLYIIRGGGHTWPGSRFAASLGNGLGRTTSSISADAIMWDFFKTHSLT
jgi:polyhydroxybutyrate depolymerase